MWKHGTWCAGSKKLGLQVGSEAFFDTVRIGVDSGRDTLQNALAEGVNVRLYDDKTVIISFDETTQLADVDQLFKILNGGSAPDFSAESLAPEVGPGCLGGRQAAPLQAWPWPEQLGSSLPILLIMAWLSLLLLASQTCA